VEHDFNVNAFNTLDVMSSIHFFGEKKQPEHVDLFPAAITIRANWENKIDVDANRTKTPGLKK